jgi:bifunctional non-homologous end joining protein LigD
VHEIKHDGYRLIVRRDGAVVRLFTRRGYDWTERYPAIAATAAMLRPGSFTLDGEAVVSGADGVAVFDALHRRHKVTDAMLYAFDLLELDGVDYRPLPLVDRKARLAKLLARSRTGIVFNEHTDEDGTVVFRHALQDGPGGHRLEAPDRAVPVRAVAGLDQGQEPGEPGDGAGAGGPVVTD